MPDSCPYASKRIYPVCFFAMHTCTPCILKLLKILEKKENECEAEK